MKRIPYTTSWREDLSSVDALDNNIDVFVEFSDGSRYTATFFTLHNLNTLMREYELTGECAGGLYIWASDMIVVRELSPASIEQCVASLIENHEFEGAFTRLEDLD